MTPLGGARCFKEPSPLTGPKEHTVCVRCPALYTLLLDPVHHTLPSALTIRGVKTAIRPISGVRHCTERTEGRRMPLYSPVVSHLQCSRSL